MPSPSRKAAAWSPGAGFSGGRTGAFVEGPSAGTAGAAGAQPAASAMRMKMRPRFICQNLHSGVAGHNVLVSTLGYALLSLLTRGPATGYDLTQRMREPIGFFWVAQHSQIYPELARLADDGHVRATEGHGPGPHAKKT